jgi:hypothetical protein
MWETIGVVAVTATTETVRVGQFTSQTDDGRIWLRVSSGGAANLRPLAFGILSFIGTSGTRELGNARYYPDTAPSVVQLGPGPITEAVGWIDFRPRSYNQRWLSVGLPARVWILKVEALVTAGETDPVYQPGGFVNGIRKLLPLRGPVGPRGAWALGNG